MRCVICNSRSKHNNPLYSIHDEQLHSDIHCKIHYVCAQLLHQNHAKLLRQQHPINFSSNSIPQCPKYIHCKSFISQKKFSSIIDYNNIEEEETRKKYAEIMTIVYQQEDCCTIS